MTIINHAQFQPSPRDMMIALRAFADLVKEISGQTPTILVGPHKLYPPNDGKPLNAKSAQAAYDALYEGKGTITVKDKNVPVFKQSNGRIAKDEYKLESKLAPSLPNPENELAKQKYQELLEAHPNSVTLASTSYGDRLKDPIAIQKMADRMVFESAVRANVIPEDLDQIIAQGSAYVNSNLENVGGEFPQAPEGIQYLADIGSEYRSVSVDNSIEVSLSEEPAQGIPDDSLLYIASDQVPDLSDPVLERAYAAMDSAGVALNELHARALNPSYEYLMESGTPENPSQADKLKQQFEQAKASFEARLSKVRPKTESVIEAPVVQSKKRLTHNEEPDNWDEIQITRAEAQDEADLAEWESRENNPENYELIPDYLPAEAPSLPTLQTISAELTPDQRYAPGYPPTSEALEATIAQLTSKIETLQAEMESFRKTIDRMAQKEPVVKVRNWAKNKLDGVLTKLQDRAKVDFVKAVNYGKDLAQKAMNEIGKTAGMVEASMLKVDNVGADLKTMMRDIHGNDPIVKSGDYTFNNDGGKITVEHKDRGQVFEVSDKAASFKGKFNTEDYKMLSNLNKAVEVLAGPAAIAAEMAKDLVVSAVKEEGKKAAIKL
jgi:hypothetical protein